MQWMLNRVLIIGVILAGLTAAPAMAQQPSLSLEDSQRLWEQLKQLEIPGVALDQRFDIKGQTFHVSPQGDDGADGSARRPWRTLARACSAMAPGTVIYLHAGEYHGPVRIRNVKATAEAPAALRAAEGEHVIIRYPDEWIAAERAKIVKTDKQGANRMMLDANGKELHYLPLITVSGSGFIEISGLHFIGARDELPHNKYSECGVKFGEPTGQGSRVLYNRFERMGHSGVKSGVGIQVEGNWIHDIGHTAHDHGIYFPGDDCLIRRNLITNSTGFGVHAFRSPSRMRITHNILWGHACQGVVLASTDSLVAHNVFGNNRKGGVFLFRARCTGNTIVNNVFLGPAAAIGYDAQGDEASKSPLGNTIDHNLLAAGVPMLARPLGGDQIGQANVTAEATSAVFVDRAKLDLRPAAGSPLLGAGRRLESETSATSESAAPVNIGLYSGGGVQ